MSHCEVPIDTPETVQPHRSRIVRWLLIGAGSFALALGALGVLLPGLPTTPFVWCNPRYFSVESTVSRH
ncbi:DUF454 family protein [Candidatus Viridilinea mediisalina]|uniref:DUF454 family protein n=1 Tax=Candidatus Viridilinea mediisalina TaxID=2024553 RepID=UPI000F59899B